MRHTAEKGVGLTKGNRISNYKVWWKKEINNKRSERETGQTEGKEKRNGEMID